jgi:DNA-binding PadR family transcriptional regulator
MSPRAPEIPAYTERVLLQSLRNRGSLTLQELYPAGKVLIQRILKKGWIEKGRGSNNVEGYRITPAGEAALVRKIPSATR